MTDEDITQGGTGGALSGTKMAPKIEPGIIYHFAKSLKMKDGNRRREK